MIVLVLNCGSSSLKYQLVNMDNEEVMAKGLVERIGMDDAVFTHKWNGQKKEVTQPIPDHQVAVQLLLNALTDKECGVIQKMDEIDAIGHRVVHEIALACFKYDFWLESNFFAVLDDFVV